MSPYLKGIMGISIKLQVQSKMKIAIAGSYQPINEAHLN